MYIGFGSLVVDEPERLTQRFLNAIQATGLRAIIQRGWGGLGAGVTTVGGCRGSGAGGGRGETYAISKFVTAVPSRQGTATCTVYSNVYIYIYSSVC